MVAHVARGRRRRLGSGYWRIGSVTGDYEVCFVLVTSMLFGEASSVSQLAEAARELIEGTERTHREFEIILALLRADRLLAQRQAQDKGWSTYAYARG